MHDHDLCGDVHRSSITTQATSQQKKTGWSSDPIVSGPCTCRPRHCAETFILMLATYDCTFRPCSSMLGHHMQYRQLPSQEAMWQSASSLAAKPDMHGLWQPGKALTVPSATHARAPEPCENMCSYHSWTLAITPPTGKTSMCKPNCKRATGTRTLAD
jgi:hypothetical protein